MKKTIIPGALALFLAGCGQSAVKPGLQSDGSVQATLYLQGVEPGHYTSVLVDVGSLKVAADGKELAVVFRKGTPDLAAAGSTAIGSFRIPNGTQNIDVTLRFDGWGGFEYGGDTSAKGAGDIDARVPAIHFQAPASWLYQRGHAVVSFDLSRSLVPVAAEHLALVPQFQVLY
jgi:hypothetical protein